jgi:hypothetical protein
MMKIAPEEYGSVETQQQSVSIQQDNRRFSTKNQPTSKLLLRSVSSSSISTTQSYTANRAKKGASSYLATIHDSNAGRQFNNSCLHMMKCCLPLANQRVHRGKCCALCRWATGKKFSVSILRCSVVIRHCVNGATSHSTP